MKPKTKISKIVQIRKVLNTSIRYLGIQNVVGILILRHQLIIRMIGELQQTDKDNNVWKETYYNCILMFKIVLIPYIYCFNGFNRKNSFHPQKTDQAYTQRKRITFVTESKMSSIPNFIKIGAEGKNFAGLPFFTFIDWIKQTNDILAMRISFTDGHNAFQLGTLSTEDASRNPFKRI